jgi:hypothetical protein
VFSVILLLGPGSNYHFSELLPYLDVMQYGSHPCSLLDPVNVHHHNRGISLVLSEVEVLGPPLGVSLDGDLVHLVSPVFVSLFLIMEMGVVP